MNQTKFELFVSWETPKPDFMSKWTMRVIDAPYSHIGIIVHGYQIYHMVGKGFSKVNLNEFMETHGIHKVDISRLIESHPFALGYLEGRLGVEYSYSQYLGFIFKWARRFVRNNREKGVCSEEMAHFLINCGIKPVRHKYIGLKDILDFVDPKQVWEETNKFLKELPQ